MSHPCQSLHCELSECLALETGPNALPHFPVVIHIPPELPLAPAVAAGLFLCPLAALTWQLCIASEKEPGIQLVFSKQSPIPCSSQSRLCDWEPKGCVFSGSCPHKMNKIKGKVR